MLSYLIFIKLECDGQFVMPWTIFSVLLGETIFSEALGWIINLYDVAHICPHQN